MWAVLCLFTTMLHVWLTIGLVLLFGHECWLLGQCCPSRRGRPPYRRRCSPSRLLYRGRRSRGARFFRFFWRARTRERRLSGTQIQRKQRQQWTRSKRCCPQGNVGTFRHFRVRVLGSGSFRIAFHAVAYMWVTGGTAVTCGMQVYRFAK